MTLRLRPTRILSGLILGVALLGAALVSGVPLTARALTNCTGGNAALDAEESAFLGLINTYRAQNGLSALTISTNLNRASAWLSQDMGANSYFSHTDSAGRSPSQRAVDCGYPSGAGENIAAGTNWDTAAEAFDAWRNSAGHNANMLNAGYKVIGIGREQVAGSQYNWYWTTDFGLVADGGGGGSTPTSTPTRTPTRVPTQPSATPTATPVTAAKAAMTTPAGGSVLPGATTVFYWTAGTGALEYYFYVGTSQGANNIFGASTWMNRAVTVTTLPTNGSVVYVRLWTRSAAGWAYNDYTYTAATVAGSTKASLTLPPGGSVLRGGRATFAWNAVTGAQEYFLYVGTTAGANNIYGRTQGLNTAVSAGIPTGGTIYVRLWTRSAAGWAYNDYTYATAP